VKDLLERYLRDHSAPNKAALTHRRDRSLAAHLLRAFGDVPLDQLRPARLAEYKASRRAQGIAPKTLNDELGLLGHAYKLAMMEWEWVTDIPVLKIAKEKVRNNIERWLTAEEEQRLFAASAPWLQEIIVFALHTGMRRGEILKLHWSHVDLARRTLTILEQKNGARDTLPVNDTAMDILLGRAAVGGRPTRSSSMGRATHGRRAICCGRFIPRCAGRGSRGSASMTCGIPLPRGSSKRAPMSIRSRNWAAGKRSRWYCAIRIISRRVCAGAPRCWIVCGEKVAQS